MVKSRRRIRKYRKREQGKTIRNRRTRKGGSKKVSLKPIPLPKVPPPIQPVINTKLKGGFKADIVDNIEDRDDDWLITKQ